MASRLPLSLIAVAVLAVGALVAPSSAQLPSSSCDAAEEWHLQKALSYQYRHDQAYHLQAAQAARELTATSGSCTGWEQDREAPAPLPDSPTF